MVLNRKNNKKKSLPSWSLPPRVCDQRDRTYMSTRQEDAMTALENRAGGDGQV